MQLSKQVKQRLAYLQNVEISHRVNPAKAGQALLEKEIPLSRIKKYTKVFMQTIDGCFTTKNSL